MCVFVKIMQKQSMQRVGDNDKVLTECFDEENWIFSGCIRAITLKAFN